MRKILKFSNIGDWGLGIGDWANPQSPIPNPHSFSFIKLKIFKNLLYNLY